jgi:hypothetical protein
MIRNHQIASVHRMFPLIILTRSTDLHDTWYEHHTITLHPIFTLLFNYYHQ